MANTLTLNSAIRGREQFQGAFHSDMWKVKATFADQDAVAITDTATFTITVPGVALGDIVVGWSIAKDLSDGTDQASVLPVVTAANTLSVYVTADAGEFAADDLNTAVFKALIVRPAW